MKLHVALILIPLLIVACIPKDWEVSEEAPQPSKPQDQGGGGSPPDAGTEGPQEGPEDAGCTCAPSSGFKAFTADITPNYPAPGKSASPPECRTDFLTVTSPTTGLFTFLVEAREASATHAEIYVIEDGVAQEKISTPIWGSAGYADGATFIARSAGQTLLNFKEGHTYAVGVVIDASDDPKQPTEAICQGALVHP